MFLLLQDLYIDYNTKIALNNFPDHQRFSLEKDNTYLPIKALEPISTNDTTAKRPMAEIISLDDDEAQLSKRTKN